MNNELNNNQNNNQQTNIQNNISNQNTNQSVHVDIPELPKLDQATTIGSVKKDKQKSPINMLILFTVLIAVIFFIPQITPYFKELLSYMKISSNDPIYGTPSITEKPENPEKPEPIIEQTYFNISETESAIYEKLTINSLSKTTENNVYYFNYTIFNNDALSYSFSKNKLYIDYYDINNTYLGRSLITSTDLAANTSITLKSIIDDNIYNNATKLSLGTRTSEDYPNIALTNNTLTCTLDTKNLIYTLKKKNL